MIMPRGRLESPLSRQRLAVALLSTLLVVGGLTFGGTRMSAAQECADGTVLSDNGVTCEALVGPQLSCPEGETLDGAGLLCIPIESDSFCPAGERLDDAGLLCIADEPDPTDSTCPAGEKLDELGLRCIVDETADAGRACDPGFSLGADRQTCIADGPKCGTGEVLDIDGSCIKTFQCSPGLILASDLLSCLSGSCPEGELPSVDGSRCLAPDSNCPDGSPRPVGGACLVVEANENEDGSTDVVVRCDAADLFCQALINQCSDDRASGAESKTNDGDCEDPRTSCGDDDADCDAANDRLVDCATLDRGGTDDEQQAGLDACDDLCPRLHRLDPSGECVEYLDPTHPCVSFGRVPRGVTTNVELDRYSYLAGTGQCVTRFEFLRRLGNFEAAAGAELDALSLLREITTSYLSIEERLAELDHLLTESEQNVRAFTEQAAQADLERARSEKMLLSTRKQLTRESELLRAEVLEFFVAGGSDVAVTKAVLGAANLTEVGVTRAYGRALLYDQVVILERVTELEADTEQLSDALAAAVVEVRRSLDDAIAAQATVAELLVETEMARTEQLARRDEEAALVSALREDKAAYAQQLGVFDQASREIADIIAQSEFEVTTFRNFEGFIANPVIPARVVSGFGPRLHPILGYVRSHNGIDFDANFGAPIYASAPGVVQIASTFGGYGQTVVIDHGGGRLTLYAHMSVIAAEAGDEVERGDIVGLIGSTGLSTGPHLHFEVWIEGKTAVDPRPYLDLTS